MRLAPKATGYTRLARELPKYASYTTPKTRLCTLAFSSYEREGGGEEGELTLTIYFMILQRFVSSLFITIAVATASSCRLRVGETARAYRRRTSKRAPLSRSRFASSLCHTCLRTARSCGVSPSVLRYTLLHPYLHENKSPFIRYSDPRVAQLVF